MDEAKEHWMRLCEQAQTEQDPQKFIKLIDEIFRLLEEKRMCLNEQEADEGGDQSPCPTG